MAEKGAWMAANRIKGIIIEIGGDTTKLQTALKGVNTQVKSTQAGTALRTIMNTLSRDVKICGSSIYKGLWSVSFTLKEFY